MKKNFRRQTEENRYDSAAIHEKHFFEKGVLESGIENFPSQHTPPFLEYYAQISRNVSEGQLVLEIGIGTGRHSHPILEAGGKLTGLDVSEKALNLCKLRHPSVVVIKGSMESLPFDDSTFDVAVSCASLSYGNSDLVDSEISRVLKKGGSLIVLDSLNHNPIYRLNRYCNFLKGERTKKTLENMPDLKRIRNLSKNFESHSEFYFGTYFWFRSIFISFGLESLGMRLTSFLEKELRNDKYAFKFVLVARKLLK